MDCTYCYKEFLKMRNKYIKIANSEKSDSTLAGMVVADIDNILGAELDREEKRQKEKEDV